MTNIVNLVVNQQETPAPSTLQGTVAIISESATSITAGTRALLTKASDLTPLLTGTVPILTLAWAAGIVTLTTTVGNFPETAGATVSITVTGCVPAGYNGTFTATVVSGTQCTYPLAADPGVITTEGAVSNIVSQLALTFAVNTWFAQSNPYSVYVLELGTSNSGVPTTGLAALTTYINNNLLTNYVYVVPLRWMQTAGMLALTKQFSSTTSCVYFVGQSASLTDTGFVQYSGVKSAVYCEANSGELFAQFNPSYTAAAVAFNMAKYNPSATNKVTPMAYAFVNDVSVIPTEGNGPYLATLQAAFVNFISIASEGGLTNTMITYGTTMDGRDFTYWYSVDWVQINLKLNLANEIINGSNNPINPLYYNQDGINRLKARAQQVMNSAVTFGLANGSVTVNATSFADYTTQNPNDYAIGVYKGLSVTYTPARGFLSITFNVTVTDFVTT